MIYLHKKPVTSQNREEILHLELKPEQNGFIESPQECLAEAERLSLWRPVGLYDGENLVGFAMYGAFPSPGGPPRVWLDRFLIAARFQGKGYGRSFLPYLVKELHREYSCDCVYLSLFSNNRVAQKLYEDFGFRFNGEKDMGGEDVMVLEGQAFEKVLLDGEGL